MQVKNTNTDQDVGPLYLSMINTAVTNTQISDPAWSSACISCLNCEVQLDQVQFINNTKVQEHGLMMFDRSNISINKSLFSNNQGGVLYARQDSRVDVLSSTFSHNTAKSRGGVMYLNTNVNVSIASSEFVENTAGESGGVVYGEDNIFLVVFRSNFTQNKGLSSAWFGRGGVAFLKNNVSVMINSCNFTGNSADKEGGVVYAGEDATVRIESCSFTGNKASEEGGVVSADQGVTVRIDSSSFTLNRARSGGVALLTTNVSVTIDSCSFIGNSAWHLGGVVFVQEGVTVRIDSCSFTENRGGLRYSGGEHSGVVWAGGDAIMRIESCRFTGNSADWSGGVVSAWKSANVSIDSCSFTENSAGLWGGVVHARDGATVRIVSCSFTANSADRGGVVSAGDGVTVMIDSCGFTENWADYGGVVYAWKGAAVRIDSCSFTGNSASEQGGVVSAWGDVTVRIDSCSLTGNLAGEWGGVVYAEQHVTVRIDSCNFTGNSAGEEGGAVYAGEDATVRMDSCTFTENSAENGGVVCARKDVTVRIEYSYFTGNSANEMYGAGGVVYGRYGVTVRIDSCSFIGNSAEEEGGVVYAWDGATVTIDSCSFTGNSIRWEGGVVYAEQGVTVGIDSCNFTGNSAGSGGVVYAGEDAAVTIDSCSFTGNSAEWGGVVCVDPDVTVRIDSCNFNGNSAARGGVVYGSEGVIVEIGACHFHSNWAKAGGQGTICIQYSVINITNTLFENNSQSVIISQEQHSMHDQPTFSRLSNCTFINNIQLESEFPTDLFFSAPVILSQIYVTKTSSVQDATSILTTTDTVIKSLVVDIQRGKIQNVVTLNKVKWDPSESNPSQISFTCPEFLQPRIITTAKSQDGLSVVRLVCESCSVGYYHGNTSSQLTLSSLRIDSMICEDMIQRYIVIFSVCKSHADGKCLPCPHGANCTRGITTLPNYWGVQSQSGQVSVARCPSSYCCKESPCSHFSACSGERGGTLCGRCKSGFSKAMFSEQCVPDESCGRTWLLFVSLLWTVVLSVVIFFANGLKQLGKTLAEKGTSYVKMVCHRMSGGKWNAPKQPEVEEEKNPFEKDFDTFLLKQNKPKAKGPFKTVSAAAKERGFDTKFVQIIFFYIQDASLLQVDLYRKESEEGQSFWTQLVFNISQLAIELLNFSKSICFMRNTTPISKVLMKSALGPSILMLLLLVYFVFYLVTKYFSCPKLKNSVYENLSYAAMFVLLLFFQKLATASLSLVHCIAVGDKSVLFVDGTVECYQAWQFTVFAFLLGWVMPFILVLTKGPVLLSERKIDVSEFFLACFLPVPVLVLWTWKGHKQKWKKRQRNISTWHVEMIESIQKSFKDISVIGLGSISWNGVIKARRLVLVFVYTFVSNLVIRLATMILFTAAFLGLHLYINPYEDKRANQLFSVSMCAILLLGLINGLKAAFVESLVQLTNVKIFLKTCEVLTDIILLWAPVSAIVFGAFLALFMIIWRHLRPKPEKLNEMEMEIFMRTSNSF